MESKEEWETLCYAADGDKKAAEEIEIEEEINSEEENEVKDLAPIIMEIEEKARKAEDSEIGSEDLEENGQFLEELEKYSKMQLTP